jgi:hypothetical protein
LQNVKEKYSPEMYRHCSLWLINLIRSGRVRTVPAAMKIQAILFYILIQERQLLQKPRVSKTSLMHLKIMIYFLRLDLLEQEKPIHPLHLQFAP